MISIYVRWIKEGRMELSDVPSYWRDDVSKKLEEGDS